MRNPWSTTTSLLRRHPALWLPVLLADVANFWLTWLERILHRQLIEQVVVWLSQSHSVLGDTPDYSSLTPAVSAKAQALTAPLIWITRYLGVCLYTAALIATAAMVYSILNIVWPAPANLAQTGPSPRSPKSAILAERARILLFALKFFLLNALVGVVGSWLVSWAVQLQTFWEKTTSTSQAFQNSVERLNLPMLLPALLMGVVIAAVMAPIAVRLLQPPGSVLSAKQRSLARLFAVIALGVTAAIQVILQPLEGLVFQHLGTGIATLLLAGTAVSLITAIPFVPLYVSLALIAEPDATISAAPEPSDFPTPAHIRESAEP
jgi:hypothetical protein